MNRQVCLVRTMLSIQRCTLHWGAMSSCRWTRGSPLRVSRNPVEKRPSGVIIRNTTLLLVQFYSSQPTQIMHVCSQWTQRNTQLNNREHRQGDPAPTRVSLSLDHEAVLTSWSGVFFDQACHWWTCQAKFVWLWACISSQPDKIIATLNQAMPKHSIVLG